MTWASKIPGKITTVEIKPSFRDYPRSGLGQLERLAMKNDLYVALALTVRDSLLQSTVQSTYLEFAELAMAARVKQPATGKTIFSS